MSYAAQVLRRTLLRLVTLQLTLTLATGFGFLAYQGANEFWAAIYGGAIALLNTSVSAHRLIRATQAAADDAQRGMMEIYIGAITRFVATPLFVAIGIAALKLDPVALIVGFAVAQLGYMVNNSRTQNKQ